MRVQPLVFSRALPVVGLCLAAACDPFRTAGFELAPQPAPTQAAAPDSAQQAALGAAMRVAARHGLDSVAPASVRPDADFTRCAARRGLALCGRAAGGEVEFELSDGGQPSYWWLLSAE